ncbi:hypothetical protein V496_00881 [Pseudogymnoascus sp. VKM F-4515 (FW-2607)]|nr:hypothetical protein V496_00881 [Pseudogymnoascus sp. VKM F-4515 (FW-2607)]
MRANGREQGLAVPAVADLVFLAKADTKQLVGFRKPRVEYCSPNFIVVVNQSTGHLQSSHSVSRGRALVRVPYQINIERWNKHRLRIDLEESQEFTIPVDRALQAAFNGRAEDPQLFLHFINKERLSLNGLDELGDGGICANSLAATFDELGRPLGSAAIMEVIAESG